MSKITAIIEKVRQTFEFEPLSIAAKCRRQFTAAVLLILALALLIPYFWMSKLAEKSNLDAGRAIVETVYQKHFDIQSHSPKGLAMLDAEGGVKAVQDSTVRWISFTDDSGLAEKGLTKKQIEVIDKLIKDKIINDQVWLEKTEGKTTTNYINIIRAKKNCLNCHNITGTATSYNEPAGAVVVKLPGKQTATTVLMNRICIIGAGLLAGAGAIVAFYVIAQRVILSPIRQLRALVSNIAEGTLETRCAIKTGDEFQRLGDALNEMLDGLVEGQAKLRLANKQLDAKITELSERNIELFKANKLKSEFLANMSHEFRTPLNAILGFADILREKSGQDIEKSKRYAENIIKSGRALLTMINDLLEMAKAEAGKLKLHIEKTNIAELCNGLAAFFSPLTEKRKIKVRVNIADEIPVIHTDPGKVQQILYNFISNAIKYTDAGGKIEIKSFMPNDNTIRISVIDTGCGIAEKDQEKIFEKFRQVDGSIIRNEGGTGLGLAISKELASMLAANISLKSTPGQGSEFSLDLPIMTKQS